MDEAARILSASPERVIFVNAESTAEGAFVLSLALLDHRPQRIVIRSSKVMSNNSWTETKYHPLMKSTSEVLSMLESIPVDAVLVDLTATGWPEDRALLLQALQSAPTDWRLANDLPVSPANSHHLQIFRNIKPQGEVATEAQIKARVEAVLSEKRE